MNSWVTTSVRVLRASGPWEAAATSALSADARGDTILKEEKSFLSSSQEDVSVNNFCIVEGASVCLLATHDVHFGKFADVCCSWLASAEFSVRYSVRGSFLWSFVAAPKLDSSSAAVGKPGMGI